MSPSRFDEVLASRRAIPDGSHHFGKAVADGKERVIEPVLSHPGIAVAHLEAEDVAEGFYDRLELPRHETDLPHPEIHIWSAF